jgi:solute carrier family 25 uncoupling protein 8/9
VAEEGLKGLWTGVGPNIARNAIINACELATYDQVKTTVLKNNMMKDGLGCHFFCGFSAGFVAVCIGSPVDVMKTRIMNAPPGQKYEGVLDCFAKTLKQEGPLAFYAGFQANFLRIVSWNIVMFIALEQIKSRVERSFYPPRF